MRKKQKKKSRKQWIYSLIRFALWSLFLFVFIGIYGLFEDTPSYNVFLIVSLTIGAFITIGLFFVAYCPNCKWFFTFRIWGNLFTDWISGGDDNYFCSKCEKTGAKNTFI